MHKCLSFLCQRNVCVIFLRITLVRSGLWNILVSFIYFIWNWEGMLRHPFLLHDVPETQMELGDKNNEPELLLAIAIYVQRLTNVGSSNNPCVQSHQFAERVFWVFWVFWVFLYQMYFLYSIFYYNSFLFIFICQREPLDLSLAAWDEDRINILQIHSLENQ